MTSQEVLASPSPSRHPVRRTAAALLVLGVVGTGVVLKLTSGPDDPGPDAPAPAGIQQSVAPVGPVGQPAPPADAEADVVPFYPPTPLDGHWASARLSPAEARAIAGTRPGQRLTLQIRSTALVLWVGTRAQPNQRIIGYEAIYVDGHRVQLSPVGSSQDKALYRWRIRGQRLSFELVRTTSGASPSERLVTLPFVRRS